MPGLVPLDLAFLVLLFVLVLPPQLGLVEKFLQVRHDAVAVFTLTLGEGPRLPAQPLPIVSAGFVAHGVGSACRVPIANLNLFKHSGVGSHPMMR